MQQSILEKVFSVCDVDQNRMIERTPLIEKVECLCDANVWECGVYRGYSAFWIAEILQVVGFQRTFRLFDTFYGFSEDMCQKGLEEKKDNQSAVLMFRDTSVQEVKSFLSEYPFISMHSGIIPDTFMGLEDDRISFAYLDVDIYYSVKPCLEFIWPKLLSGGMVLVDDYMCDSCKGATLAVNEFCASRELNINRLDQLGCYLIKD